MANRIRIDVADLKFEDNTLAAERTLSELSNGDHSAHHTRHESGGDDEIDLTGLLPVGGWTVAGETWTYASSDAPIYTFTIAAFDATTKYSIGMKIKLTDNGVQFGFITKVVFDDPNSTITVYMGTDYSLSGGAITSPYYSTMKAPLGFPLNPAKWTVEVTDVTERIQDSPVQDTWYNLGTISINIPIGTWDVSYNVCFGCYIASGTNVSTQCTLSTANNSESDVDFTSYNAFGGASGAIFVQSAGFKSKPLNLVTKDVYYINTRTGGASMGKIYNLNQRHKLIIRAICVYL